MIEKKVSLLGLDKLAQAKRLEKQKKELEAAKEPSSQRSKVYSYKDDGDSYEDINRSKRMTHPEVERQK